MAIEIKELVIKMTVQDKSFEKKTTATEINQSVKNRIVQECVEKVLEKLESKIER